MNVTLRSSALPDTTELNDLLIPENSVALFTIQNVLQRCGVVGMLADEHLTDGIDVMFLRTTLQGGADPRPLLSDRRFLPGA